MPFTPLARLASARGVAQLPQPATRARTCAACLIAFMRSGCGIPVAAVEQRDTEGCAHTRVGQSFASSESESSLPCRSRGARCGSQRRCLGWQARHFRIHKLSPLGTCPPIRARKLRPCVGPFVRPSERVSSKSRSTRLPGTADGAPLSVSAAPAAAPKSNPGASLAHATDRTRRWEGHPNDPLGLRDLLRESN